VELWRTAATRAVGPRDRRCVGRRDCPLPIFRTDSPTPPSLLLSISWSSIDVTPIEWNEIVGIYRAATTPPQAMPQRDVAPSHFEKTGGCGSERDVDPGCRATAVCAELVGCGRAPTSSERSLFGTRTET